MTKKLERTEALLALLASRPSDFLPADDLGNATELGPAVYPLLAELDRLGAVERCWSRTNGRRVLCYRLTSDGRGLAQAPRSVLAEHLLER